MPSSRTPLRVAHVVNSYGKLSESFIPDALQQLEGAGAEAWVATMEVVGRDTYAFPPDERLVVCPPPWVGRRVLGRLRGVSGAERFAEAASARLTALAPAVAHAQFAWAGLAGTGIARRLSIPSVATFHGTDVTTVPVRDGAGAAGWRGPVGHEYAELFPQLDMALAVSDFIADKIRALGYEGRIEIVPAGVDLERLHYRGPEPPAGPPRLSYIGRLNAQKGLALLLKAMPVIRAQVPEVSLDVIGGGPDEVPLRELATELGLDDHVTFHGAVPSREAVFDVLGRAHVQVVPSRAMPDGAAEGSPVVTKEAQAIGVPLVSTATGGIAGTVPPEYRDDLVPGDDPDALAAAAIALLCDPEARAERSQRGRAWVEEQFDQRFLAQRTVDLYESLIA